MKHLYPLHIVLCPGHSCSDSLSKNQSGSNHLLIVIIQFSSVQSLSRVRLFATPWTAAHQASLSITNSRSPPKLMSIESVMPSNHLIFWHPLLLPSIFPSIRVFSNESALHIKWPKYWSFNFSISPDEHPGLISFGMDWLDLLAVQGTQESSPTPYFKSITSSVLSFLYSLTLTSIHDYWKNHSLWEVFCIFVFIISFWESVEWCEEYTCKNQLKS